MEASICKDTTKDSVVHSTGYVAVLNTRDWTSVTDDDEILLSCGSTSLTKREC